MNNNNKWSGKRGGGKPSNVGVPKWIDGKARKSTKNFKKFVDTDRRKNESSYSTKNERSGNNNRKKSSGNRAGISTWIRKAPINPLIMPQQCDNDYQVEEYSGNKGVKEHVEMESIKNRAAGQESDKEKSVGSSRNNSVTFANPFSDATETAALPAETNFSIKIKQEKAVVKSIKQEKQSPSESSSESSSSEEEPKAEAKIVDTKPHIISSIKRPPSLFDIKLKPVSSIPINTTQKLIVLEPSSKATSSSSSSSSDEESNSLIASKMDNKQKLQVFEKGSKPQSMKNGSEDDDVVCIGKLENKIVLEDDSGNENVEKEEDQTFQRNETLENTLNKKSKERNKTKCVLCDKKGHTSLQCQMICKNCSAHYHGYRTCPQPANLNLMLQLFMEFCMQQFQNFNAEKQTAPTCDSVPKSQDDSLHSNSVINKLNKLKRKQVKSSETKASKKLKISSSKKTKRKPDSDESSNDDNSENDTDSETSSTESEDKIDKRKRKTKNQSISKATVNLSNFPTNSVNLPMVLNSFSGLTVPNPSVHNPNTSTNALNTLLLTQMFQNAMGSLK